MKKGKRRQQGRPAVRRGGRAAKLKAMRARHLREYRRLTGEIAKFAGLLDELPPPEPGTAASVNEVVNGLVNALGNLVGGLVKVVACMALEGQLEQADDLIESPDVDAATKAKLKDLAGQLWEHKTKNC